MAVTANRLKANNQTLTYIDTAIDAGCPRDQVERFVSAGYVAQPKQLRFHSAARECDKHDGPVWILFGGARGPGKSHAALAQVGLDDCQRVQGLKTLFLRKIQRSAAESLEDLTNRVFYGIDHNFIPSKGRVSFPNGSRILLGGFNNERDIDKYLGIEYDEIVVEEITQISEERITKLRGSLRTSRPEWRVRFYISTNPGGIGHRWVKKTFVDPYRRKRESLFLGGLVRFIPGTYRDNKFLDTEYIDYLLSLTGPLGKAWRDGDWDAFEGMAFPQWDERYHVIDPRPIPESWVKWRAIDWGYAKPFACLWMMKDPDTERIYVYRELYQVELTDRQQARMIVEMTPPMENIAITYADPSMWARQNRRGEVYSTAQEYGEEGVMLSKADNDRLSGKRKVDRLLGRLPDQLPGLQIFSTCKNLIETLPALPLATRKDQVTEDVDTDAEDHAYDALRYGLTNVRALVDSTKKTKVEMSPMEQMIRASSRL